MRVARDPKSREEEEKEEIFAARCLRPRVSEVFCRDSGLASFHGRVGVRVSPKRARFNLFIYFDVWIFCLETCTYLSARKARRFDRIEKRIDGEKSVENVEDEWSRK